MYHFNLSLMLIVVVVINRKNALRPHSLDILVCVSIDSTLHVHNQGFKQVAAAQSQGSKSGFFFVNSSPAETNNSDDSDIVLSIHEKGSKLG